MKSLGSGLQHQQLVGVHLSHGGVGRTADSIVSRGTEERKVVWCACEEQKKSTLKQGTIRATSRYQGLYPKANQEGGSLGVVMNVRKP
jgi:hypothetical protein